MFQGRASLMFLLRTSQSKIWEWVYPVSLSECRWLFRVVMSFVWLCSCESESRWWRPEMLIVTLSSMCCYEWRSVNTHARTHSEWLSSAFVQSQTDACDGNNRHLSLAVSLWIWCFRCQFPFYRDSFRFLNGYYGATILYVILFYFCYVLHA